ncbi:MAG: c-type cytochrome [Flavipsychrobacter sp.]|nr:c-type cytochrome [Flavipsychrobacter sp.]
MRKVTPIFFLSAALAAATIYSCKKSGDHVGQALSQGTEVLEMPAMPYDYSGSGFGIPVDNNKAALGRVLFYDRHLSINNSVSCGTCHKQALAFADDATFSRGFENRLTGRNSMPLQNLPGPNVFGGVGISLFWDGRSSSLNDLILRPINNHVEMGVADLNTIPAKLAELPYYRELFSAAYGDGNITNERISESVTTFLQSIQANRSKLDRQQQGEKVMNAQELYGMTLFDSKYNCRSCHTLTPAVYYGTMGQNFVNIGLETTPTDKGRAAITGNPADEGKFRIPNLHNIALTAPYMHDGRFTTLEEVIEHYSHNIKNAASLDSRLKGPDGKAMKMNITTDEKAALVAFLKTLTDYEMITDPKFSNPFKIK